MSGKILVMYSGGLDSVYMLHKVLTDPQYNSYVIHAHHVNIFNYENRAKAETLAVEASLKWFRENNYRNFTDSVSDYKAPIGMYPADAEVTFAVAGKLASTDPQINKIAFGATKDDFIEYVHPNHRRGHIERAIEQLQSVTASERIHPLKEMLKSEIYADLPEGLKDKFWSCRTPKYIEDKPQPCYRCKACSQFQLFGVKLAGI